MFGVGMHFSLRDLLAVRAVALPGAARADRGRDGARRRRRDGVGLAARRRAGLRPGAVGGEHRRAAARAGGAGPARVGRRPDRRRLAGRRGSRDGARPRAPAGPRRPLGGQALAAAPRRATSGSRSASRWASSRCSSSSCSSSACGSSRGSSSGSRTRARASSSPWPCIALALGVAFGSAQLFGVSFALGAFFAGMVINESDLSQRAASDTQPLQDAFAALFFVAVGMLFDPGDPGARSRSSVLAVVAIIVVGKSLAALAIVLALRLPAGHGADGLGGPRADRRVLVHPRRPRRRAGPACRPRDRA